MMFVGKHLLPKKALDADQKIDQEIEANKNVSTTKQAISGIILLVCVAIMALNLNGSPWKWPLLPVV